MKDYYEINYRKIKEYLEGTRSNPLICTNKKISKKLQKDLNVKLEVVDRVDVFQGLFMYKISEM